MKELTSIAILTLAFLWTTAMSVAGFATGQGFTCWSVISFCICAGFAVYVALKTLKDE